MAIKLLLLSVYVPMAFGGSEDIVDGSIHTSASNTSTAAPIAIIDIIESPTESPSASPSANLVSNPSASPLSNPTTNPTCTPSTNPTKLPGKCANENELCECTGMVRYGADTRWSNWVDTGIDNSILCSNSIFGDPAPNIVKQCQCQENEMTDEQKKEKLKEAFDEVQKKRDISDLPQLVRKAFHDAAHFDKTNGRLRLGCLIWITSHECPVHKRMEGAMGFHKDVKAKIDFFISDADIIQLLGALAVDFMSKDTEYKISLFSKMHIGRKDISKEDCHAGGIIGSIKGTSAGVSRKFIPINTDVVSASEHEMCKIIPEFHAKKKRQPGQVDEASLTASLNAVWNEEIQGKMVDRNSFSKREAVALIGAHTVGMVKINGFEGVWDTTVFKFDNEYFKLLKEVKDQGGPGKSQAFSTIHTDWFQDQRQGSGQHLLMLDSDMTLVLNAPELVEEFAKSNEAFRHSFDEAYVKMSELGWEKEGRRRLTEAELDEAEEFLSNVENDLSSNNFHYNVDEYVNL